MKIIRKPKVIKASGKPAKKIEEFIGMVNSRTKGVSIARMKSPAGWSEPGQTPEFDEYSVVLKGRLLVKTKKRTISIGSGQAAMMPAGKWVRYSTPEGAEYISVCIPAFSIGTAHRDVR